MLSSLMVDASFSQEESDMLRHSVSIFIRPGGYCLVDKKLVPKPAAANKGFDIKGAELFHEFKRRNKIPCTAWTKVAANATPSSALSSKSSTTPGIPWASICAARLLRPVLQQQAVGAAHDAGTTWFAAGHEPDEPVPLGEAMLPYFTKAIGYDAVAVIDASGEDFLRYFDIVKSLKKRQDADRPLHHLVGIPSQDGLPEEANLEGRRWVWLSQR
ncbi:inosine/uridine-preferring nucleoside hydrolase [Diplocarpon rosae]|nr:inosine/uridine-preferring nucleoside hydrolase [Diplocarpon rosae]